MLKQLKMEDQGPIIEGAQWVRLSRHEDDRGLLTVLDDGSLPFSPVRFFTISAGPGAVRGEHASSSHELIACLSGTVVVDLNNGATTATVTLDDGSWGLWVKPGVWLRLHSFGPGTILGVAANLRYVETQHWPMANFTSARGTI